MSKYNKRTQWHINWADLLADNHVYALVIKGTADIQGLVAIQKNPDWKVVYITWMCAAPHNSRFLTNHPKYLGVGGHLFAIAIDKSFNLLLTRFMPARLRRNIIMSGPMQSYNRNIDSRNIPEPIHLSQLPRVKMDLAGLSRYAKNKGVSLYELSEQEKAMFLPKSLI
ncbi:MAG: hypothetical protein Q4F29_01090 [Lachnospiraceae bacterium]|nr:hypothetical protein [Lachnospiraceae bacterium]